eukprot:TRINITY_DN9533_c0_g2_i1.p2 TRINITY_DN9533_c0_g2~~TRINITY_DN9533_c0_g2_i1.p2  ORF type:complete len:202 (-),score=27.21 TRINITY_DN9533_c0_g2_i1:267-872(-)
MDNLIEAQAAFSIANIAETGVKYGRHPGEWYGPLIMMQIFEELNEKYKPFPGLEIVVFPEGVIYVDKLRKKFNSKTKSVIVLVGFRLGLKRINSEYYPAIIRMMEMQNFIGMSGGQDDGALYFIGYQNDRLIFLDPHVTQPAIPYLEDLWTDHLTYHYPTPLLLPVSRLNTCFAIGVIRADGRILFEDEGRVREVREGCEG